MSMSVLEFNVLGALKSLGPCSNADIARHLGISSSTTYRGLQLLVLDGLATHPKKQEWIATRLGITRHDEEVAKTKPLRLAE